MEEDKSENTNEKEDYRSVLEEVIQKQSVILGPQVAIMRARNVEGLKVTDDGVIREMNGDPKELLQTLIDQYVELSGQIVKNALGSIFTKYPSVKHELDRHNGVA